MRLKQQRGLTCVALGGHVKIDSICQASLCLLWALHADTKDLIGCPATETSGGVVWDTQPHHSAPGVQPPRRSQPHYS